MKKWLAMILALSLLLALPALAESAVDVMMEGESYHLTLTGLEVVDGQLLVTMEGFGSTLSMGPNGWKLAGWPVARYGDEAVRADNVSGTVGGAFTFTVDRADMPDEVWIDPYDEGEDEALIWSSGDAAPAEAPSEEPAEASVEAASAPGVSGVSVAPGDRLYFGRYDQDADAGNGTEPIAWIVLDVDGGLATLMSRDVLDARPYNGLGMNVTWEKCSLRKWLNGDFLDAAFDDAERAALATVAVTADVNPECPDTDPGADTEDTVCLLSVAEALRYFGALHIPPAMPTETAVANGVYVSNTSGEIGQSIFWLRSPGDYSDTAAYVVPSNGLQGGGTDVSKNYYGVRPVVRAKLDDLSALSAPVEKVEPDYPGELDGVGADAGSYVDGDAEAFAALSAGDNLLFGRYDQDNDPDNGAEGIEWIVLEARDGAATLMSRYALDARAFNGLGMYLSWDRCSLRQWLNGAFLSDSFTDEERAAILETHVTADANPEYPDGEAGADTDDRVYLLSIDEAAEYFGNLHIAPCQPTRTAVANGAYVSNVSGSIGTTTWWLRTTGGYDDRAVYIHSENELNSNGDEVGRTDNGVRPVIRVDAASLPGLARIRGEAPAEAAPEEAPEDTGDEYGYGDEDGYGDEEDLVPETAAPDAPDASAVSASGGFNVGDIVTFGRYEQDDDAGNGSEPIEWIVLASEADARLLVSRYGLYPLAYDRGGESATWETCGARAWLNSNFLNDAFTEAEQALILEAHLENPDNPEYGTDGGGETDDKVFFLSVGEAERYIPADADRATTPTAYAVSNGAYTNSGNGRCWWWLRTPGSDDGHAAVINSDGASTGSQDNLSTPHYGETIDTDDNCARPAIWMLPPADGEQIAGAPAPEPASAPEPEPEPESAPESEPEPEPEPEPAPDATIDDILSALGDETYRATYDALLAGEVVAKGSKGDTAKGVQQTLIAFGQDIAADGSVGPKTLAALNAVQTAFGMENTDSIDAAAYEALMPRLLIATDEDAAYGLLSDLMGGEYDYTRACALQAKGLFYSAKRAFEDCGYGDWEDRAAACAQPWPKTGQLYKNPDVKGNSTQLCVKFNSEPDTAMLVKIYTTDDVLARTMFIGGTGKATVSLPAGQYIIKDGTGQNWYGEIEAFGDEGYYEVMTFDDYGTAEVTLKSGYTSTITVNVQEFNPNADSVGSAWESWDDF